MEYQGCDPSPMGISVLPPTTGPQRTGGLNVLGDLGAAESPKPFFFFLTLAILDEDYEILSGLPDSVLYTCGPCAGATHPRWREALSGALQGGLRQVLQGLLSSKVAVPLLLCTQVWRARVAGGL